MIRSILTVCVGNICRSPMAEGLLQQRLPNIEVSSAGIGALSGRSADPIAIDLLRERGLDITSHRARQISDWMCRKADLILVMEAAHKRVIERTYRNVRGKLFLIGYHGKFDVFDPYRQGRERFEACLNMIACGVDTWAARIEAIG
ncbi:low molecular weight protein-tyrosine-phosphatase [Paraburkholderia pallida]|uniref:protein-tyrosine-phosphatase n=1 Tax=Paraburkholderia pallida TaxID=2547399 RepID=A0A4P7CLP9_9BURK|nr:low molecular weight protein-tyrosine-phosphatase [Paraburkholderia pallida]QBQ96695.1 low molecular weight phosphotyrosine protein phosphatase [Paraburkholderia pallida]